MIDVDINVYEMWRQATVHRFRSACGAWGVTQSDSKSRLRNSWINLKALWKCRYLDPSN